MITLLLMFAGVTVAGAAMFVQAVQAGGAAQAEPALPPAAVPVAVPRAATGPLVALTFDDGPSPERTPYVLDVLKEKGVTATFFLQGSHAEEHPDLVRRIRDEGHVIGNHSYSHAYFPDLAPAQAREEIVRTNAVLQEILGAPPVLFRYPHGESSRAGDEVLNELNLSDDILWHWDSALPGDFECPGAAGVQKFVTTESVNQAAILLHDANDTLECPIEQWNYLPRTIDALKAKGFDFGVVEPTDRPSPANQGSRMRVVVPRTGPGA
ncbi:polysaccharide deacetylase family protein [Pseudonocardia sp.]|uniref:polysaccharide deacetylase family protein n=1 Tax=Pseudonocardia sp. TaxID=60912 RepID=UPI003D12D57B